MSGHGVGAGKVRAPTPDQMESAAEWLDFNEGEGEELESCKAVAAWLREQASAKDLRIAAKANGVPVKKLRHALAKVHNRRNLASRGGPQL